MVFDVGEYDREITIKQITESKSASGAITETESNFAALVYAKLIPLSATERFSSDAEHSALINTFRVRAEDVVGINEKMWIVYNSVSYRILGIKEVGRFDKIDLLAEAIK